MTLARLMPRDSSSRTLFLLALGAITAYGYFIHKINLPEEWLLYCLAGAAVGLLIGRWPAVLGGFVALAILVTGGAPDDELEQLVFFVYVPMAALSIAAGVALRRGGARLLRRHE